MYTHSLAAALQEEIPRRTKKIPVARIPTGKLLMMRT